MLHRVSRIKHIGFADNYLPKLDFSKFFSFFLRNIYWVVANGFENTYLNVRNSIFIFPLSTETSRSKYKKNYFIKT